jgi:hypothetical protein
MRIFLPLLALAGLLLGWTPTWLPEYQLTAAGTIIDVGYYAAPCVVDWDGDGVKDLILGQFSNGSIRFYKNQGTNAAPEFTTFEYLYADGSIITLPYG